MSKKVKGFSKWSKKGKIEWLAQNHFVHPEKAIETFTSYWHADPTVQKRHDEFIENTVSNYFLPLGVAPNFSINDKVYTLPMAIEESSVVAAAAKSAQFWIQRGGFKAQVLSSTKIGHIHFLYQGDGAKLERYADRIQAEMRKDTERLTANMEARGGGILSIKLVDKTEHLADYYQWEVRFDTRDSMGANFINSCLEQMSKSMKRIVEASSEFTAEEKGFDVVMCILSNYTPECLVRAEVRCRIEELEDKNGIDPQEFARKFHQAVRIAEIEPYRATTHNKGIMNGVDAVILATGNDFRAVEAACHTYASRTGKYSSLTHCTLEEGYFTFWIEIPLSLGVVGGLTQLHPLVKLSLEMLGNPNAHELMCIVASSGLAQNFAALRALTTTGIQKGHMKMHLFNILNQLEATDEEKEHFTAFFADKVPHHADVVAAFCERRGIPVPLVGALKDGNS